MGLRSWFSKRANAAIPSTERAGGFMAGVLPGIYSVPPPRTTAGLLEASTTMPWLHAVAWKAGDGVAAQPWTASVVRKQGKVVSSRTLRQAPFAERQQLYARMKAQGELEELEEHPILDFLSNGNPYFPGRMQRGLTQVYLDLVGEAYWIKERNSFGMPIRAWSLPPTWIMNLPGPEKPTYRVGFRGWQGEIPESEILRFVKPNPVHPYERGSAIARSLGDEIETYEYSSKYTKQVFFNQARPDIIISGKEMGRETTDRLEQRWISKLQGIWNVAKPFFIGGSEITVTTLPHNFQHLETIKLREHERDMIIQTFGYPPEIFGINQHSNRATISEASYIAARYVILPRLELQREFLQTYLVPEFDDRIILDFVSPVEEDRDFQLKVMSTAPFKVNEHRALARLDPLDGPEGEMFVMPTKMQIVDELKPTPKPQLQAPKPAPQPRALDMGTTIARIVKEEVAALTAAQNGNTHQQEQIELALRSRVADLEQRLVERAAEPTPTSTAFNLTLPDTLSEQVLKAYEVKVPTPAVVVPQPKKYRDIIRRDEDENSPTYLEIIEVVREVIEMEEIVVTTEQVVTPTPKIYTETIIRDARGEIAEIVREVRDEP